MSGVAIASTQLFYGRTLSQARNSGFGVTLSFMPRLVKVVPEKSTRIKFWSTSIGLRSLLWDGPSGGILPLFLEPQNRRSYHIYETNPKQEIDFVSWVTSTLTLTCPTGALCWLSDGVACGA